MVVFLTLLALFDSSNSMLPSAAPVSWHKRASPTNRTARRAAMVTLSVDVRRCSRQTARQARTQTTADRHAGDRAQQRHRLRWESACHSCGRQRLINSFCPVGTGSILNAFRAVLGRGDYLGVQIGSRLKLPATGAARSGSAKIPITLPGRPLVPYVTICLAFPAGARCRPGVTSLSRQATRSLLPSCDRWRLFPSASPRHC